MRKISTILFSISFLSSVSLQAQIKKGATFLGGNLSFSAEEGTSTNNNDYKTGGVYILPVVGKAVKENLIVGADILFYYQNSDVSLPENDLKQWIYGTGFFIRQYQQIKNTRFSLFLQGGLAGEYNKVRKGLGTDSRFEKNESSVRIYAYPGVSYAVSRKLQLETGFNNLLGIRYFHTKTVTGIFNEVKSTSNGFNLYASLENQANFYIGFRLLLNKK
ncbi:MAG: hypothetical protein ABIP79_00855 [Chitinophagaceae bacterium]